jgi:hypothetical protein
MHSSNKVQKKKTAAVATAIVFSRSAGAFYAANWLLY